MNISASGNFLSFLRGGILKCTQDRMQRQQETEDQVNFFEAQKDNLKNMVCESPEEIQRKLEMFHSYDDQIAAVKAAYNHEQMSHIMDEAKETGEKIAEAVEKTEPKTPEERKKEMVEEALGVEEQDGLLSEVLDQLDEAEEMMEDAEAVMETMSDAESMSETETISEAETMSEAENMAAPDSPEAGAVMKITEDLEAELMAGNEKNNIYRPFDVKI